MSIPSKSASFFSKAGLLVTFASSGARLMVGFFSWGPGFAAFLSFLPVNKKEYAAVILFHHFSDITVILTVTSNAQSIHQSISALFSLAQLVRNSKYSAITEWHNRQSYTHLILTVMSVEKVCQACILVSLLFNRSDFLLPVKVQSLLGIALEFNKDSLVYFIYITPGLNAEI